MTTVAEGVENQTQFDFLGKLGCDVMQGYHIARPMPAIQVTALLDANQSLRQQ
jgi:EAL domain-containing protein (putative c-di-GMP-specific phosphodiesterase class I)